MKAANKASTKPSWRDVPHYNAAAIDAHTGVFMVERSAFTVETVFVAQNDTQHVLVTKVFEYYRDMHTTVFKNRQELHGQARENRIIDMLMTAEKEKLK